MENRQEEITINIEGKHLVFSKHRNGFFDCMSKDKRGVYTTYTYYDEDNEIWGVVGKKGQLKSFNVSQGEREVKDFIRLD